MYVTDNFDLNELVPSSVYNRFGHKSIWFIDLRIVEAAEYVRKEFGVPITINDWSWGGNYQMSGFRPKSSTIGAEFSQHLMGRALDLKFEGISVQEVYKHITENEGRMKRFFNAGITVIEDIRDTTSDNKYGGWLHIDNRYTGLDNILIVRA